ncbi:hypothetical protein KQI89_08585 [Clostridium sp. MSJ-4]|uniref:Uncharacterized protein n=1 Tax=Clostridium simiarum TaxID=2841506 RepID=A0ABS6F0J4_9CLOT|nr:hypothetical protein [Clostridium simiarum]MBU5591821.1 hypothetical protein [Clostridium simiarum]
MIIIIKAEGRKFKIPLPTRLLTSKFVLRIIKRECIKNMDEDQMKYLEVIDFDSISHSMRLLRKYKGLKIVDIKSKDGEAVEIIV